LTEEEGYQLRLRPRGETTLDRKPTARFDGDVEPLAIEGFDILECLGRGGMGVVYKARDRKLQRLVAIKIIAPAAAPDPERVLRFRTEAEAAARLHHPNIVPIFEIGEAAGRPYFCSEYVDGGTLAGRIAGSPQPANVAARMVETLARAID
jgi:serine/threonine-protein kinase